MEMAKESVLELLKKEDEKLEDPIPSTKKTPFLETLKKINEQMVVLNPKLDDLTALRQEIGSLHLKIDNIKSSIGTLITLMEKKVDMDALEATVLNMLKDKMETG